MAGAGYNLFTTGSVLTAAQVNNYLQEQAVMRFASSAARTSALSAVLAEGMMSYLADTNAVEVYDGTNWVSVGSTGDITGVTAGVGISGGGTSGDVTVTNSMATAITTAGDLIKGTGSGTFNRLGIGSTGQVLTVAAGAPSWATPSAAAKSYSLIGTGTLTAASTITVSGISGMNTLYIFVNNASASAGNDVDLRINTDATSKYNRFGNEASFGSTYSQGGFGKIAQTSADQFFFTSFPSGGSGTSVMAGGILIDGCNSSGVKMIQSVASPNLGDGTGNIRQNAQFGYYTGTSTVSSVSLISTANFDAGVYYVYGSA